MSRRPEHSGVGVDPRRPKALPLQQAIAAKCLQCVGPGERSARELRVGACPSIECALFPVRPHQQRDDPADIMPADELEARVDSLVEQLRAGSETR